MSCRPSDQVHAIVESEQGVWISMKGSSLLTLWDPNTLTCHHECTIAVQGRSDTNVKDFWISSLLVVGQQLLVGTHAGSILIFNVESYQCDSSFTSLNWPKEDNLTTELNSKSHQRMISYMCNQPSSSDHVKQATHIKDYVECAKQSYFSNTTDTTVLSNNIASVSDLEGNDTSIMHRSFTRLESDTSDLGSSFRTRCASYQSSTTCVSEDYDYDDIMTPYPDTGNAAGGEAGGMMENELWRMSSSEPEKSQTVTTPSWKREAQSKTLPQTYIHNDLIVGSILCSMESFQGIESETTNNSTCIGVSKYSNIVPTVDCQGKLQPPFIFLSKHTTDIQQAAVNELPECAFLQNRHFEKSPAESRMESSTSCNEENSKPIMPVNNFGKAYTPTTSIICRQRNNSWSNCEFTSFDNSEDKMSGDEDSIASFETEVQYQLEMVQTIEMMGPPQSVRSLLWDRYTYL